MGSLLASMRPAWLRLAVLAVASPAITLPSLARDFSCGAIADLDLKRLCHAATCLEPGIEKTGTTTIAIKPEWVSFCKTQWDFDTACRNSTPKAAALACTEHSPEFDRWLCDHARTWNEVICSHCSGGQ